jgi:hypothetical protein
MPASDTMDDGTVPQNVLERMAGDYASDRAGNDDADVGFAYDLDNEGMAWALAADWDQEQGTGADPTSLSS